MYSQNIKSISNDFFKEIKKNEGIIKYYFGEVNGIIFGNVVLFLNDGIKTFHLGDVTFILNKIEKYNKNLSTNSEFDLILSNQIYKSFVEPIIPYLSKVEKLIFIQNIFLKNLPFHTLATKLKNSVKASKIFYNDYLVKVGLKNRGIELLDDPEINDSSKFQNVKWLIDDFSISYLPSLKSFYVLRTIEYPKNFKSRFVGFGNPKLKGNKDCKRKPNT